MAKRVFMLSQVEPASMAPDSAELAEVIVGRIGLMPRKKGSTKEMYKTLIELYERTKQANRDKKPELAVMTVEEMGNYAGITRQTMYDYLRRWVDLDIISKTSYIYEGNVIIGYKLNGNTLEQAFMKAAARVKSNLETTLRYVKDLQNALKKEKISESMRNK